MKMIKLIIASILAATTLMGATYNVDKAHTNVGFKVKHLMISNVSGRFDNFSGSFEYDAKTKTLKSLNGVVQVASINTENEKRDKHLRSSDFFDAKNYPQITFELTKVVNNEALGVLTMRGISKNVIFELENNGSIKDPWGNIRVGLSLTGKINRLDYGIEYNKILEVGGVMIGDMVKIIVDIEGIKAK
jgi:polyisoprenoid-binding protein YceI